MLIDGQPIPSPLPSIRLYIVSKMLKFAHLPDPGGLLDQNPIILGEWTQIAQAENEAEAKRQKDDKAKADSESRAAKRGSHSRHPRTPRRR